MDTSILEELGLSKGEITVYTTLLSLGTTKVGPIIEKSAMASSAVHNALHTLINKGFVSSIKKGKISFYQPAPARYIGKFIEQKKQRFLELLPELEAKEKKQDKKQEAEVFEGLNGVTTMLNLFIEDLKKGDEFLFFATEIIHAPKINEEIQEFFQKYDLKRKEKGLNVKGLAPRHLKHLFENRKGLEVRYPRFPIPKSIGVVCDSIEITCWQDKPIGYLIRSKEVADSYRELFYKIWKTC